MNRNQLFETLRMAFASLTANRMRSVLTILGVVIGIATVITISSIITGLNNKVAAFSNSFGTNSVYAFHMPIGVRPTPELLARKRLTVEEAFAMRALPHIVGVNPAIRHVNQAYQSGEESVKYRGKSVQSTILEGDSDQIGVTNNLSMRQGALFTPEQAQHHANVVVLCNDTAQKLFGEESAVGKDVEIQGEIFTVTGVADKKKQPFGSGKNPEDNMAYMPLGTFHKLFPGDKDVWITARYDKPENKTLVEEEMRTLLRIYRKVPVARDDDFAIFTPDAIVALWGSITSGLVLFMIAVSSVGLMVGGVGVMNIMLVSVTERTREIGIRKAIGATRRSILIQFTTEAMALCALGGVIGVLTGGAITLAVRLAVPALPAAMSLPWTVTALIAASSIGLVFGIYPAWKAASLDPIDALRYE